MLLIQDGYSMYRYLFLLFSCSISAYIHWEDPPSSGYEEIFGIKIYEVEYLAQKYHKIPKDKVEFISLRISALDEIIKKLDDYKENPAAILLQKQISAKVAYLTALRNLPSKEKIIKYHTSNNPNALTLRNNITYSLKMHEYWGAFWLESIDPCHRRLAHYYVIWKEQNPECKDYLPFFLWLEMQYIPPSILSVKYLNEKERAMFEATIENGKIISKQSKALISTGSVVKYIYIITLDEQLYIAPWGNTIWHTSFSCGKPVLGSGLLTIENGIITGISFESGHYLPSIEQGYRSLNWFQNHDVFIENPLQITYFLNRKKYTILLSEKEYSDYPYFIHLLYHPHISTMVSTNEF